MRDAVWRLPCQDCCGASWGWTRYNFMDIRPPQGEEFPIVTLTRRWLPFLALLPLALGLARAQPQGPAAPAIALQGMDVVSYFREGGPVPGQPGLALDFDGSRYLFSTAENRAAFVANPDRFLPQFGGLCTTGLSKGIIGQGSPHLWSIVGGRLFLFSPPGHREAIGQEAEIAARATEIWANNRPARP